MDYLKYNTNQLIYDLTPVELRTRGHQEWVQSISSHLETIRKENEDTFGILLFDATHTGQVLSLEHYLNYIFGLEFPVPSVPTFSIWIGDGEFYDQLYLFKKGADALSELNNYGKVNPNDPYDGQCYIFQKTETITDKDKVFLYTKEEIETGGTNFYVYVPYSMNPTNSKLDTIMQIINRYKKVGKTYKIIKY